MSPIVHRHSSLVNSSDPHSILIPFARIIENALAKTAFALWQKQTKAMITFTIRQWNFTILLIILIFLSGLGQHCAEWSSRVPNCFSVLLLKLLLSLKRKSIERQMHFCDYI